MTKQPSKNDLIVALTRAYEQGDLQYIETVSNIAYGYKVGLKRLKEKSNEQRLD